MQQLGGALLVALPYRRSKPVSYQNGLHLQDYLVSTWTIQRSHKFAVKPIVVIHPRMKHHHVEPLSYYFTQLNLLDKSSVVLCSFYACKLPREASHVELQR